MDGQSGRSNLNNFAKALCRGAELRVPKKTPDVIRCLRVFDREMRDAVARMAKVRRPKIPIVGKESGLGQPVQDWDQVGIARAFLG